MEEIVKHINDTNASYRALNAGDAKNTDLFLDNEHYDLFKDSGDQITVRYNKENLSKAILFIASILPRKYDNSAVHKTISYSTAFVLDQLAFLDGVFTVDGVRVESRTQIWNARKDVMKANGEIDRRFYFNGLLEDINYTNYKGERKSAKFTIRNYFAGGYSDLHIKKANDGIFDVWITNTQTPYDDGKDKHHEIIDDQSLPLQQIFYGAPGTGKSHCIKDDANVKKADEKNLVFRTTFHPDSDYSTFVGAYKPTMKPVADKYKAVAGKDEEITYEFIPQAFLQAYIAAWNNPEEKVFLVIEEINRGNCAQIFGDLFQLLDRDDKGFSEYPIKADRDLAKYLKGKDDQGIDVLINKDGIKDEKLQLPKNLFIWATMNTSDQSLFPIDSAFKRRWDWVYMPIGYKNTNWTIEIGDKKYEWVKFQRIINDKIYGVDNSEDKQLGDYFVNADRTGCKISADTLLNKILFYIWNDVCKDDPDQIFQWVNDKKQNESIKFSDFFGVDKDKKLQGFMAYNKVPAIGETDNTDNTENTNIQEETPAENDNEINS